MNILKDLKNKKVVGIFAHPDDEAFGPSGTIAKLAKDNDVYLLCATKGEAGGSGKVRSQELKNAAKILGVKEVHFLGFIDGMLSNSLYHKLAAKIEKELKEIKPDLLITFEPRGVSGHIDHITVSLVTTFVFSKLPFIKTLLYTCLDTKRRNLIKDYFIYFPPGYKRSQIDLVVDVSDVWQTKVAAMFAHKSQIRDVKRIMGYFKNLPKEEYFLILKK